MATVNLNEIYLKNNSIIINGNGSAYGIFFYKVKSKKIFNKWSRRVFICSNKEIHFFKMRGNKRIKQKIIYFTHLCKLSGLECAIDKFDRKYFKFSLSYNFGHKTKIYNFKSYNEFNAPKIYSLLNNHISSKLWDKFVDC